MDKSAVVYKKILYNVRNKFYNHPLPVDRFESNQLNKLMEHIIL